MSIIFENENKNNNQIYAALSVAGRHHRNEDRYIAECHRVDNDGLGYSIYAVCDGHGGQFVVDYATENLPKNIADALVKSRGRLCCESLSDSTSIGDEVEFSVDDGDDTPSDIIESEEDAHIVSALKQAFHVTDKNVIDECRKIGDWSGSCVCVTLLHNNIIYLANLGDSSAVIFQFLPNTNVIHRSVILSQPHKPKLEEQRIDSAGGWVSADGYVLGVLGCSRSLGDRELKYFDDFEKSVLMADFQRGLALKQQNMQRNRRPQCLHRQKSQKIPGPTMKCLVSPKPDIQSYPIGESDALLVIASDGLWDFVLPKRSVELVNEAFSKSGSLQDVCDALVSAAQRARSTDDITVVVISLQNRSN